MKSEEFCLQRNCLWLNCLREPRVKFRPTYKFAQGKYRKSEKKQNLDAVLVRPDPHQQIHKKDFLRLSH